MAAGVATSATTTAPRRQLRRDDNCAATTTAPRRQLRRDDNCAATTTAPRRVSARRGCDLTAGRLTQTNCARAASSFAHARTQARKIFIRVHQLAFDGFHRGFVVSALIQRDPQPLQLLTVANLWPRHALAHSRSEPFARGWLLTTLAHYGHNRVHRSLRLPISSLRKFANGVRTRVFTLSSFSRWRCSKAFEPSRLQAMSCL